MSPCKRNRRTLMASFMLVAFALRVLIPPGFMPAGDRPFSLEICWEGLPADMQGHVEHAGSMGMDSMDMASMGMDQGPGHHHETSSHSEHCVFGTACGAGPFSHLTLPSDFSSAHQLLAIAFAGGPGLISSPPGPQSSCFSCSFFRRVAGPRRTAA